MTQERVVRLFLARPLGVAFDPLLRDVLVPDLRTSPGLLDLWVGRRGPDELGDRAVVGLWTSRAAMEAVMGRDLERSRFHPELLPETTARRLEVLPLLVEVRATDAPPAAILRIARGRLPRIELGTYAEHVAAGARRDMARGRGPNSILVCRAGPDSFVTISTWPDWDAIAAATGATIDRPVRTREQHEIEGFRAAHLELVRLDA